MHFGFKNKGTHYDCVPLPYEHLLGMSTTFHKLTVHHINAETEDCVRLDFVIPQELTKIFEFHPGQYLTFRTTIDGEEIRRSYSICSQPGEEVLSVAIKKISNGKFSTFANNQLKAGAVLDVMAPTGNFTLPDDLNAAAHYVFYAAGSGITPCLSMMGHVLEHSKNAKVSLFYGNRHTDSIIFREKLEGLKNLHLDRFGLYHILSKEALDSPLFSGRINAEKCATFEQKLNPCQGNSQYFLCGPAEMVFEVKETLASLGVDSHRIHFELFTTEGLTKAKPVDVATKAAAAVIKMKLDGLEFEFDYHGNEGSILDAALKNGADLPFACKGGVCSTCKAHCDEGEVTMAVNYALEPDEVEAGYVLTCQSVPKSSKVYINFDR